MAVHSERLRMTPEEPRKLARIPPSPQDAYTTNTQSSEKYSLQEKAPQSGKDQRGDFRCRMAQGLASEAEADEQEAMGADIGEVCGPCPRAM
jgi:hypothetical protein